MSEALDAPEGIRLGVFCGPTAEGSDWRRWQIETDGIVVLTREETLELALMLVASVYAPQTAP